MGYRNAKAVLPPWLLSRLQEYAEGECIYIPRREQVSRPHPCDELTERNAKIWQQYRNGCRVQELAQRYYLSTQAIYKILSKFR